MTPPSPSPSPADAGLGAGNPKTMLANLLRGQAASFVNASGGYHQVVTFCGFDGGDDLVTAANAVQSAFEGTCGQPLGDEFAKGQASMTEHRRQQRQDHEKLCRNGNAHARCAMTAEEYFCHVKEQELFKPASRLQIHLDRKQRLLGGDRQKV